MKFDIVLERVTVQTLHRTIEVDNEEEANEIARSLLKLKERAAGWELVSDEFSIGTVIPIRKDQNDADRNATVQHPPS